MVSGLNYETQVHHNPPRREKEWRLVVRLVIEEKESKYISNIVWIDMWV